MNIKASLAHYSLALLVVVGACAAATAQTPIFIDDFETGTSGGDITNPPWGTLGSPAGVSTYQTSPNPFPAGLQYARFSDQANAGNGVRLINSGPVNSSVGGQITTFSFDFYEPVDTGATDVNGMIVGYSHNNELNGGGRSFGSLLVNGSLNPQNLVGGSGAAKAYPLEKVHTLFMVANDTASALSNYHGGRTLQPAQADLWLAIDGGDPEFAFSVNKQNPTQAPRGIGFRTFTADIEEVWVNNVLLMPGANFDRTVFPGACFLGDTDCDDIVDVETDFEAIRVNFRRSPRSRAQGDLTGDGTVDFNDFIQWKSAFLEGSGSLAGLNLSFDDATVPEPTSLTMLAVCALSTVACSRRKRNQQS